LVSTKLPLPIRKSTSLGRVLAQGTSLCSRTAQGLKCPVQRNLIIAYHHVVRISFSSIMADMPSMEGSFPHGERTSAETHPRGSAAKLCRRNRNGVRKDATENSSVPGTGCLDLVETFRQAAGAGRKGTPGCPATASVFATFRSPWVKVPFGKGNPGVESPFPRKGLFPFPLRGVCPQREKGFSVVPRVFRPPLRPRRRACGA